MWHLNPAPSPTKIQGVALIGAFFFFQKDGRFCCVKWCCFVVLLHHLVPARIPYKSRENMFYEVKTSVGETSLGQGVALYGACRTI